MRVRRPRASQRLPSDRPYRSTVRRIRIRLALSAVVGLVVGVALPFPDAAGLSFKILSGWVVGAACFAFPLLAALMRMDAQETHDHVDGEDPGRRVSDVIVVVAALMSLGGVVALFLGGSSQPNSQKSLNALVAVLSIALAWLCIHTIYTVRYARLYYNGHHSINFNQDEPPRFSDFAYLSFTLGMTYQVSDTDLKSSELRAVALRHTLLSYVFGTVIIASLVNLVAGLAK